MVFFNWSKGNAMLFTSNSLQGSRYAMWSKVVTQALVPPFWVTQKTGHPAAGTASFCLSGSAWITSNLWDWHSLDVWTSKSFSLSKCEHRFIDKAMVIPKPAVTSAQPLGLGFKLFPNNMLCMLNKDLTRLNVFPKCGKIDQAKERLCQQNEDKPI